MPGHACSRSPWLESLPAAGCKYPRYLDRLPCSPAFGRCGIQGSVLRKFGRGPRLCGRSGPVFPWSSCSLGVADSWVAFRLTPPPPPPAPLLSLPPLPSSPTSSPGPGGIGPDRGPGWRRATGGVAGAEAGPRGAMGVGVPSKFPWDRRGLRGRGLRGMPRSWWVYAGPRAVTPPPPPMCVCVYFFLSVYFFSPPMC